MTARASSPIASAASQAVAVALLCALGLPACGSSDASPPTAAQHDTSATCDGDPRANVYSAGMTQASENGKFTLQMLNADPAPPAKGDNKWDIKLTDAAGAPLNDATITVKPFMPDHGHGTSIDAVVTPAGSGGGEYSISPVNLWMPGLWQVTLSTDAAGATDDVVLGFCIAG
jgi:YtkA-like